MSAITALLLDLDGTLLDTAPEMADALNRLRSEERLEPLPFETIRPTVSHGSIRMVNLAFSDVTADEFERLRLRFLDIYRGILGTNTRLFSGFDRVFEHLRRHDMAWGVVTNKPGWLTEPLLHALGLQPTDACVVSGDTVGERKPHPLPLLHAAKLIRRAPEHCLYVGDAERDIQAGKAAGMRTVVAEWGYLGAADEPGKWAAEGLVKDPADLVHWLPSPRVQTAS